MRKFVETISQNHKHVFTAVSFCCVLIIIANNLILDSVLIGVISLSTFLFINSIFMGKIFSSVKRYFETSIFIYGFLLILAIISLVATLFLYFFGLSTNLMYLTLFSSSAISAIVNYKTPLPAGVANNNQPYDSDLKSSKSSVIYYVPLILYGISLLLSIYFILSVRTGEPFKSIWQIVPSPFFLTYSLSAVCVFIILFYYRHLKVYWKLLVLIGFSTLTYSLFVLVLETGYGMDTWSDLMRINWVIKEGTIVPLPFAKLGYYSLMATLAESMSIDVYWITWLISPVFWGALLPLLGFEMGYLVSDRNREVGFVTAFLPIFFPTLIWRGAISTSFSVGTVLFFFLFYFSVQLRNRTKGFFVVFFVFLLALINIHPLTGVPLLSLFIWIVLYQFRSRLTKPVRSKSVHGRTLISVVLLFILLLGVTIASMSLLDFFLYGEVLISSREFVMPSLLDHFFPFWFTPGINWYLNLMFFFTRNIFLLQCFFVGIGLFYSRKILDQDWVTFSVALSALFVIFSILTTYWAHFPPERFFIMFGIVILPLAAYGIVSLKRTVKSLKVSFSDKETNFHLELHGSWKLKVLGMAMLVLLISTATLSLYGAYPKFYPPIETGAAHPNIYDFQAVRFIEEKTEGRYVVLSDGITATAAFATFGWRVYSDRPWICYYPPTLGDPDPKRGLQYELFLDMMRDPSSDTLRETMYWGNAKTGYFILSPSRWWTYNIEEIREKSEAVLGPPFFEVEEKIYVFRLFHPGERLLISGREGEHEGINPIYLPRIKMVLHGVTAINILSNPSFEVNNETTTYPNSWLFDSTSNSISTWEWSSASYHGSRSFKIMKENSLGYALIRPVDLISISPSEIYTSSMYYKTNEEETELSLVYEWYNEQGIYMGYTETRFVGSTEWTRITSRNVQPPTDAKWLRLDLRIWSPGTVWFDAVQLEKRDYASNFVEEEVKHTENPRIYNTQSITLEIELTEGQNYTLTRGSHPELSSILYGNFTVEAEGSGGIRWELYEG